MDAGQRTSVGRRTELDKSSPDDALSETLPCSVFLAICNKFGFSVY